MICFWTSIALIVAMYWFLISPPEWYARWEDNLIAKRNIKKSWLS
jgi:hypothetical protein